MDFNLPAHGWIFEIPAYLSFPLVVGLCVTALIVSRLTSHYSLFAPITAAINELEAYIHQTDDEQTRSILGLQLKEARDREYLEYCEGPEKTLRRKKSHAIALILIYAACAVAATGITPLVCNITLATILFYLAATDIEHCQISQSWLFALGLFCFGVTIFPTSARWATPDMAMIGMLGVGLACACGTWIVRLRSKILKEDQVLAPVIVLGDGDVMLLLGLAAYFGPDVLAILMLACVLMLPGYLWRDRFASWLSKTGHTLANPGAGLPFVPAIALAAILILLSDRPAWLQFNRMVGVIYRNYFTNSFSFGYF